MIRVAGPEAPKAPMMEEAPMGMYDAEKETIMAAMQLIQQALMMLAEVCPPDMGMEEPAMEEPMMEEELPVE